MRCFQFLRMCTRPCYCLPLILAFLVKVGWICISVMNHGIFLDAYRLFYFILSLPEDIPTPIALETEKRRERYRGERET